MYIKYLYLILITGTRFQVFLNNTNNDMVLTNYFCCIPIIIIIWITTVIQYIYKHKYKTQAYSVVLDTNGLLISWLRSMSTGGERHNSYCANPIAKVENSTLCLHGPISTDPFSKSSNSQDHLFLAWRHPHSNPISCLGVYYNNGDCHILCARA